MATHTAILTVTYDDEQFPDQARFSLDRRTALARAADYLQALGAGLRTGSVSVLTDNGDAVAATGSFSCSGTARGAKALGTVTLGGGAGDVTIVVNGTSVGPVVFNANDAQTAADCVTALNANATLGPLMTASNVNEVITIEWDTRGTVGNAVTLTSSRTAGTATASGATLSGGTDTSVTATINGVAIAANTTTTETDANVATVVAAAIEASSNALVDGVVTAVASTTTVNITAINKGTQGNLVTLAASGTGFTASGNRLTGGTAATTGVTITR